MEPPATTWDLHALTIQWEHYNTLTLQHRIRSLGTFMRVLPCYPRQLLDFDVATEMPSYGRLTEVHGQLSLLVFEATHGASRPGDWDR